MVIKGKVQASISRSAPYATADDAIRGRRVWLSGGAGALGLLFAKALLAHGCAGLALADIADEAAGAAVVGELTAGLKKGSGQVVRYLRVDVRDAWPLRESMEEAARELGGLDTVINNAGVADEREVDWVVSVNLVAVIAATEAALGVFEGLGGEAADRVIVNVSSAGGVFAMPVAPVYAASKHGVLGYTKSMRNACWERGVRINCYCPGWASVGMGKTVSRVGKTARFTGIMDGQMVANGLVEIIQRRDLVGEAVYISAASGARVAYPDVSTTLAEVRFAKM